MNKVPKKILLVEDDQYLIDIYKTRLEKEGYRVIVVQDGKDFFSILEKENPDLILLDIVLPHIDGWEILKALRKDPKFKEKKVVIISNLSQREEIEKARELGVIKFLVKAHYTPSEIAEEIKKII